MRILDTGGLPGDTVIVDFFLRNSIVLGGYSFRVRYDPALIEPLTDTVLFDTTPKFTTEIESIRGTCFEAYGGRVVEPGVMTFAAVDWVMSLQSFWSSSVFGLLVIFGQVMAAMAFSILILNLFPGLSLGKKWTHETTPIPYRDLGAMTMTLVMGWAYLAYFQLLIIWAGNLPHEVSWYITRTQGGWSYVGIFIAVFQFAVPFLILISGRARHNLRLLAWMGGLLLFANLVNIFWHIMPVFYNSLAVSWLDFSLPVAIGGFWIAGFLYALKRRPALSSAEEKALDPAPEVEKASLHEAPQ